MSSAVSSLIARLIGQKCSWKFYTLLYVYIVLYTFYTNLCALISSSEVLVFGVCYSL